MKKILYATCAALLPVFCTAQAQHLGEELSDASRDSYNYNLDSRISTGTSWDNPENYNPETARNDMQRVLNTTNTLSLLLFPVGDLGNAYEFGRKGASFNSKSLDLWVPYCYYSLIETMIKTGLDSPQYSAAFHQHISSFEEEFHAGNYAAVIKQAASVGMSNRDAATGLLQLASKFNSPQSKAFEKAAEMMAAIVSAIEKPTALTEVTSILEGAQGTIESLKGLLEKTKAAKNQAEATQITSVFESISIGIEKLKGFKEAAEKAGTALTTKNKASKEITTALSKINEAVKATKAFYPLRVIGKAADFLASDIVYQITDVLSLANMILILSDEEERRQYWEKLQGASVVPTSPEDYWNGIFARLAILSPTRALTRTFAWVSEKIAPEAWVTTQLSALHGGTFSGAFTFPAATLGFRWAYSFVFSEETSKVLAQTTTTVGAYYLGYAPITIALDLAYNVYWDPAGTWAGVKNIAGDAYNVGAWAASNAYRIMTSTPTNTKREIMPTPNGTRTIGDL